MFILYLSVSRSAGHSVLVFFTSNLLCLWWSKYSCLNLLLLFLYKCALTYDADVELIYYSQGEHLSGNARDLKAVRELMEIWGNVGESCQG